MHSYRPYWVAFQGTSPFSHWTHSKVLSIQKSSTFCSWMCQLIVVESHSVSFLSFCLLNFCKFRGKNGNFDWKSDRQPKLIEFNGLSLWFPSSGEALFARHSMRVFPRSEWKRFAAIKFPSKRFGCFNVSLSVALSTVLRLDLMETPYSMQSREHKLSLFDHFETMEISSKDYYFINPATSGTFNHSINGFLMIFVKRLEKRESHESFSL